MKKEIIRYFVFGTSIAIISWMVGMIATTLIKNISYYSKFSNLNFIKNKTFNKRSGLGVFKWIVKNTFFKYYNQKLKLKNKIEMADLDKLREEMTFAEISHLIGFAFITFFALAKLVNGAYLFGLTIMIMNILLNLYPSLLQQENKRRIDRLRKIVTRRTITSK